MSRPYALLKPASFITIGNYSFLNFAFFEFAMHHALTTCTPFMHHLLTTYEPLDNHLCTTYKPDVNHHAPEMHHLKSESRAHGSCRNYYLRIKK
jgi:hypothetical protein